MAALAERKGRESWGFSAFCLLFLCEKQLLFNYFLFFLTNGHYLAGNGLIEFQGPFREHLLLSYFRQGSKLEGMFLVQDHGASLSESILELNNQSALLGSVQYHCASQNSLYSSQPLCSACDFFQNHLRIMEGKPCFLFTASCQECTSSVGLKTAIHFTDL